MSLLLDHNLSHRLVKLLSNRFGDCRSTAFLGLESSDDLGIWNYAKEKHLAIVTKDNDFYQMSMLMGHPPQVIWLRVGNCSTQEIADLLIKHEAGINEFLSEKKSAYLIIS